MRKQFILLLIIAVLAAIPFQLSAGTVGKLVGSVIDAGTGEPLPGCNVVIVGTTMGAATDIDGYFYILNVPPGTYRVMASMIGFQRVEKSNVRITMNQTSTVNYRLNIEAIEGETVEVVAERPMVEKDVTVKKVVLSGDEIRTAPVADLTEMLTLQSGVVAINYQSYGIPGMAERGVEEIHVRGGRSGEVGYVFDGMYIENPTYGGIGIGTRLNKFAIEEMVNETGVFSAEYGDALSMMVNYVTKTGDFQDYEGLFRWRTSEIGGSLIEEGDFLYPGRLQGLGDFAGAFGGPIPGLKGKVSFYVSGEMTRERYRVVKFDDNIWTKGPLPGNNPYHPGTNFFYPYNPNDPNDHSDPLDTKASWKALGYKNVNDMYTKLAWRISPSINLQFTNWIVDSEQKYYGNDNESELFRFYPEGKNVIKLNSDRQSLEWRHQITPSTYYSLRLARFFQRRQYVVGNNDADGDGFDDWLETRLGTDPYNADASVDGAVPLDSDGDGYPDDVEINPTIMRNDIDFVDLPGNPENDPNVHPSSALYPLGNEWLEPWQYNGWIGVGPYYNFIMQGSGRYWHKSFSETWEARFDLTSQLSRHHQLKTGIDAKYHNLYYNEVQLPWLEQPYDEYYHKYPSEFAAYIEDKIEYPYMTINLGIRVDANNYNTTAWDDPNDPSSELVDTETQYHVSPRIGISHVITERTTFTFGYGMFTQNPTYRNIYQNQERDLTTPNPIVGNSLVGSQKMTAYEFGLHNQLSTDYVLDLIGWTKEYSEMNATERVPAFPFSYTISKNIDYGTAKGVDLVLAKRPVSTPLFFQLQYTWSVAKANRADPWEGYRNTDTPETMPKREILMSYDRTHDMSIVLGYNVKDNAGIEIFGVNPLENSRTDIVFFAQSGAPYTPTIENIPQETNSERMPWIQQVNLGLTKYFKLHGFKFSVGLSIDNLFDKKNVLDVYNETGRPDDPGRRANNRIAAGQNSDTVYDTPYFYGPRRSFQFVTQVEF